RRDRRAMRRDERLARLAGALRENEELQRLALILRLVVAEPRALEETLVSCIRALHVSAARLRDDVFFAHGRNILLSGSRFYALLGELLSSEGEAGGPDCNPRAWRGGL